MATSQDADRPVRPKSTRVNAELSGGDLELRFAPPRASGFFLLFWLTGWSAGCVMLAFMVIKEPTPLSILFGVPFWASWVFVFCLVIGIFFGYQRLRFSSASLEFERRAIVTLERRLVPIDEVRRAVPGTKPSQSEDSGPTNTLRIKTLGHAIDFATGLTSKEQHWLVDEVNHYLAQLPERRSKEQGVDAEHRDGQVELLRQQRLPVEPPSDNGFTLVRDFDKLSIVSRLPLSWTAIGVTTFLMLFWTASWACSSWSYSRNSIGSCFCS